MSVNKFTGKKSAKRTTSAPGRKVVGGQSPNHRGYRADAAAPVKKRWNADERAARTGDAPARTDRRPDWTPREERPAYGDRREAGRAGRDQSSSSRQSDRPSYGDRPARTERPSYGDRPQRTERPSYGDRPNRTERPSYNDRPARAERPSYDDRPARTERPAYGDRREAGRAGRDQSSSSRQGDRPSYGDRPARTERPSYNDRPARTERPSYDRPQRSFDDRPKRSFDDRAPRRSFDERPPRRDSDLYPSRDAKVNTHHEDVVLERLEAQVLTAGDVEGKTFRDLGLGDNISRQLASMGAESPFPIQAATIPDVLAGKDVLGRGKTGSGKTIAFGAPLVERLMENNGGKGRTEGRKPRALILAPTRELAMQIDRTVQPIARSVGLLIG